ncbi:hypothetical protein CYMTET_11924, partial [Cymbomonas tetramitiformis]
MLDYFNLAPLNAGPSPRPSLEVSISKDMKLAGTHSSMVQAALWSATPEHVITAVGISSDPLCIWTGAEDGCVIRWNAADNCACADLYLYGAESSISSLTGCTPVNPDCEAILSISSSGETFVWDCRVGECASSQVILQLSTGIHAAAAVPGHRQFVLINTSTNELVLLDTKSLTLVKTFQGPHLGSGIITVMHNPGGKQEPGALDGRGCVLVDSRGAVHHIAIPSSLRAEGADCRARHAPCLPSIRKRPALIAHFSLQLPPSGAHSTAGARENSVKAAWNMLGWEDLTAAEAGHPEDGVEGGRLMGAYVLHLHQQKQAGTADVALSVRARQWQLHVVSNDPTTIPSPKCDGQLDDLLHGCSASHPHIKHLLSAGLAGGMLLAPKETESSTPGVAVLVLVWTATGVAAVFKVEGDLTSGAGPGCTATLAAFLVAPPASTPIDGPDSQERHPACIFHSLGDTVITCASNHRPSPGSGTKGVGAEAAGTSAYSLCWWTPSAVWTALEWSKGVVELAPVEFVEMSPASLMLGAEMHARGDLTASACRPPQGVVQSDMMIARGYTSGEIALFSLHCLHTPQMLLRGHSGPVKQLLWAQSTDDHGSVKAQRPAKPSLLLSCSTDGSVRAWWTPPCALRPVVLCPHDSP